MNNLPENRRSNDSRFAQATGLSLLSLIAIAAVLFLGPSRLRAQQAGNAGAAPAGNATNGAQIFTRAGCYECHDRNAEGGGRGTGPRLARTPLPFAAFTHQVRSPANSMPPYTSKVISDTELADIYAFLQSLPKPPNVDSIPLLRMQ